MMTVLSASPLSVTPPPVEATVALHIHPTLIQLNTTGMKGAPSMIRYLERSGTCRLPVIDVAMDIEEGQVALGGGLSEAEVAYLLDQPADGDGGAATGDYVGSDDLVTRIETTVLAKKLDLAYARQDEQERSARVLNGYDEKLSIVENGPGKPVTGIIRELQGQGSKFQGGGLQTSIQLRAIQRKELQQLLKGFVFVNCAEIYDRRRSKALLRVTLTDGHSGVSQVTLPFHYEYADREPSFGPYPPWSHPSPRDFRRLASRDLDHRGSPPAPPPQQTLLLLRLLLVVELGLEVRVQRQYLLPQQPHHPLLSILSTCCPTPSSASGPICR
jgi:hypothetical protein